MGSSGSPCGPAAKGVAVAIGRMTADPRPRDILATVGHVDGQVWPGADLLRARRERDFPAWPDWPFLLSQDAHALVNLDMAPLRCNRTRTVPSSGPWPPRRIFQGRALHGFWVHLGRKLREGTDGFRLVLDVARTPARPVPTRTKRGPCSFPPSGPPACDVGVQLGGRRCAERRARLWPRGQTIVVGPCFSPASPS